MKISLMGKVPNQALAADRKRPRPLKSTVELNRFAEKTLLMRTEFARL
jgi:hypothetical protein